MSIIRNRASGAITSPDRRRRHGLPRPAQGLQADRIALAAVPGGRDHARRGAVPAARGAPAGEPTGGASYGCGGVSRRREHPRGRQTPDGRRTPDTAVRDTAHSAARNPRWPAYRGVPCARPGRRTADDHVAARADERPDTGAPSAGRNRATRTTGRRPGRGAGGRRRSAIPGGGAGGPAPATCEDLSRAAVELDVVVPRAWARSASAAAAGSAARVPGAGARRREPSGPSRSPWRRSRPGRSR